MAESNPLRPSWAPMLRLLPLLALYIAWALLKSRPEFIGDEGRYVIGARNILSGFLASEESLYLWNGPGYPLYLVPFVALGLPLVLAKLGNAALLFLALVRFRGSLGLLAMSRGNLAVTYALGLLLLLHGPGLELLMTECLSAYFVCGAAWHYLASVRRPAAPRPWMHPTLAGLHLAGLALTKVFFGYAITAGILACGLWWAASAALRAGPAASAARRGLLACAVALALCSPYLAYTYQLTGKAFFWSNSGGSQLYCMTLREKELLGDWLNFDAVLAFPEFFKGQAGFYRELSRMDYVSRDAAMKAAAVRNIQADPGKYFKNWRANVNRMVFGYPVSRYPGSDPELATGNRSFVYALPFFLVLFTLPVAWKRRRSLPPELQACLGFAVLSLGGLSLVSAFPRMVFPLLPLLGLWTAAVWNVRSPGPLEREGGETAM